MAVLWSQSECARTLLKLGAAVDAADYEGVSALVAAASEGHTDCVKVGSRK